MMSKKTIKYLFVGVMIWLPVQYGIVGIVGFYHSEPWPAFVFPGFKNVYIYEGGFEIAKTEFMVYPGESGEPISLQPQELFPEIPLSQVPGFMRTHFSDASNIKTFSPQAINWLEIQAKRAAGDVPVRMDVVGLIDYYSISDSGAVRDSLTETTRTSVNFVSR